MIGNAYGLEKLLPKNNIKVFEDPFIRELFFFREANNFHHNKEAYEAYNGPGCYGHAVNLCNMLWGQEGNEAFKWHPDLETALQAYCEVGDRGETLLAGPASAGKTFGAAIYCLLSLLCDPNNTGILCCSTTLDGLKKRLWGDIRKLYHHVSKSPMFSQLNIVDSLTCIQSSKGDTKRGIFGIAVAQGNESKALGKIIGFHPPRIIVVVDELTDVGWAIVEACTNLFTGKMKAHFIGIGNPSSIFDSHGKMCEPKEGWNSVNVEMDRWETLRGGTCIHFDGNKSPNIVAGKTVYDFLIKPEEYKEKIENNGENSPYVWRFCRGFWAPEGTVSTVLSEPLIKSCMCMERASWESAHSKYAGLDPAFDGGDRCVLRFGENGNDSAARNCLELGDIVIIKPDATKFNRRPLEYQIADAVKAECEKRGVPIRNFGMDTTGAGAALAAIITNEWGAGFHRCNFGGAATDLPAGPTDSRPSNEVYFNKVTELWYFIRTLVTSFVLKGLDHETALELCSRRYEVKGKIRIESKTDMKMRPGAKSPDLADAVAVLADTIKHRGNLGVSNRAKSSVDKEWLRLVLEFTPEESEYSEDSVLAI